MQFFSRLLLSLIFFGIYGCKSIPSSNSFVKAVFENEKASTGFYTSPFLFNVNGSRIEPVQYSYKLFEEFKGLEVKETIEHLQKKDIDIYFFQPEQIENLPLDYMRQINSRLKNIKHPENRRNMFDFLELKTRLEYEQSPQVMRDVSATTFFKNSYTLIQTRYNDGTIKISYEADTRGKNIVRISKSPVQNATLIHEYVHVLQDRSLNPKTVEGKQFSQESFHSYWRIKLKGEFDRLLTKVVEQKALTATDEDRIVNYLYMEFSSMQSNYFAELDAVYLTYQIYNRNLFNFPADERIKMTKYFHANRTAGLHFIEQALALEGQLNASIKIKRSKLGSYRSLLKRYAALLRQEGIADFNFQKK